MKCKPDRMVFINLLTELKNDEVEVYKTTGKVYTASDMIKEISNETEVGIQYTNALLRTVRDFLIRKTKRK